MPDDHRSELARRLCAAVMSQRLGMGMDYALKNHVKDAGDDPYWLTLADRVGREVAEKLSFDIEQPPTVPPTSKLQ
jgi:hypothetical protein